MNRYDTALTLSNYFKWKYHLCMKNRKTNRRNAHPCVVHSKSGSSPWMFWDGPLWHWCRSGPGSVGQESTQPASVLSLFSSGASWSGISLWMPVLTSELVSQPISSVSGLWRDTDKESETERGIHKRGDEEKIKYQFLIGILFILKYL